jgi:predicted AlkP superfamily pyrophosphatase or phosphodiesterase
MYARLSGAVCTLFLGFAAHPSIAEAAKVPGKAVFIILDGIPADVIERLHPPVLTEIARAGGYARSHVGGDLGKPTQTPTISAPGYMSLITGTWANKHNVWDNDRQSPNYRYWNLFRIVETVAPDRKTAIFSSWLDNRTVLIGEGKPGAGDFRIDHAVDGLENDTAAFPHDPAERYILAIDDRVSSDAAAYIAAKGPDLSWVYLEYTDSIAHETGDGEAFDAAVQHADALVGCIWKSVKQREARGEDWMIVVTTDHGRDAVTGKDHGGQSARERTTWIATNNPRVDARFKSGTSAIIDIAPSILQYMGIAAPPEVAREMEGVSFLRPRER